MKNRFYLCVFVSILLGLLTGCAGVANQAPTIAATVAATQTALPSETPAPSQTDTPVPSSTLTPSVTASSTATQTATPSETPRPSFAGFQVASAENTSYGLLMGFHIPGIKENYRLTVNGSEYKCELNSKAPDSLFCYGKTYSQGQTVKLAFYSLAGDATPLYETTYKIALVGTPTIPPGTLEAMGKACQIRGVHVTCETEYRRNGDSYCIVSSCFDLCGYYYSTDTCPEGSISNGTFPMTGTPPMPGPK